MSIVFSLSPYMIVLEYSSLPQPHSPSQGSTGSLLRTESNFKVCMECSMLQMYMGFCNCFDLGLCFAGSGVHADVAVRWFGIRLEG